MILPMHLIIDGQADPSIAAEWTPSQAARLVSQLVDLAAMTTLHGPESWKAGRIVGAWAIITESHITAHLDTLTGRAWLDVFSCKAIPPGIPPHVSTALSLSSMHVTELERTELD